MPPSSLVTIPPHIPFLDALAADWLAGAGPDPLAVSDGLILLPTRRAARALAAAFLRQSDGQPLLLPRIAAFGALDEAPLALSGALDLPPAVDPALRLAQLTRLILGMDGRHGAPRTADRAWALAAELAALMDEAQLAEIDLAARLPEAAGEDWAAHWAVTLEFLGIVTAAWPGVLAAQGLIDPAERLVRLLDAQAEAWRRDPPAHPVLAAGSTGGIPAVARLLRVVAGLPRGRVVLPGLDTGLDPESWEALDDSHPQAGLRRLLRRLGADREAVTKWGEDRPGALPLDPAGGERPQTRTREGFPKGLALWRGAGAEPLRSTQREDALRLALLPARSLGLWRDPALTIELGALSRLSAADQQEEAVAIALILRDALERPGARAALVTPDRSLARRVAAELLRFGVIADDSAGEALAETPPAVFLRLLAQAVTEHLAPVPLLSLLKHPLCAAGLAPTHCRAEARGLELRCLRGPKPPPGIDGLRRAGGPTGFIDRLEARLAPLLAHAGKEARAPAEALTALIEAAEALAATDTDSGAAILWSGEEGEALSAHLASLRDALVVLPPQPLDTLPGLLDASLAGIVVRSRRALRGRGGIEHPRVLIWGLLEARLQAVDVVVLGGLTEGVWPEIPEPGPWMSRAMRMTVGLPAPEEKVGQAAHDFVMAACSAPVAVLSVPGRRDGAPAVPARWVTRLEALLAGQGRTLPEHPATLWARALDRPVGAPAPVSPPAPCPPVAARPRRLSVTAIETWLRDPYAIYARHVLGLEALRPLEESADHLDYGTIVHAAICAFLGDLPPHWPEDAADRMRAAMAAALGSAVLRPALAAWWRPRLARIADWVAAAEQERRAHGPLAHLGAEVKGQHVFDGPAGPFRLVGRADRIERRFDSSIAILDYKTGSPPSNKDVAAGRAPQLTLEAFMAEAGAFGEELTGTVTELVYWHLTGGFEPGKARALFRNARNDKTREAEKQKVAELTAAAGEKLARLIARFDDPGQPYLSQPNPAAPPRFSDYAQLARVGEWAVVDDAADDPAGEDAPEDEA